MSRPKALEEEQERILRRLKICQEGYGLLIQDEEKMILKHFKTGFEVIIRKEGIRRW